jgi:hypothetical protein
MGGIEQYLEELELAVPSGAEDAPSADIVRGPEEPIGIPYCEWLAQQLNRLFLEHGATPHKAPLITAGTVEDGLSKLFRAKKHPPDADSDTALFKSCSLCRGPLGDQSGSGYFVPPDHLNKRLGKPANAFIEVTLCSTCFARPDREAAMERSILDEQQRRKA